MHRGPDSFRLHRRQFVVGPGPLLPFEDWRAVELAGDLVLSHDPALPVRDTGGRVVIGAALPTSAPERGPDDTDAWSGRWALIEDGRLRLDATGSLAVFHRRADGRVWVSSSPELLRSVEPSLPLPRRPIVQGRGMDWFPPPASGIEGVRCLLPSQSLRLGDGAIERHRLLPPVSPRSEDATLDALAGRLVTALRGLRDSGAVWLALTAGRDSRLVLAAAVAAGLPVTAYTLDHPAIGRADRDLPPRIAAAAGVEHRFITGGAADPARLELWDRHTAGHAVETERPYFARGQLDAIAGAAIELGGSVFEVGRGYYHAALPAGLPAFAEATAALLGRELPSVRPDGVLAWAQWLHASPDEGLDWRDRFYVEQRLAGWLGAIEQGADLLGMTRLHVANCAGYLAETLSLPAPMRHAGVHQAELVRRLAPALADFPVNPPGPVSERVTNRVRRELVEVRAQPSARSYAAHRLRRYAAKRAARRR